MDKISLHVNSQFKIQPVSWQTHHSELSAVRFEVFVEEQGFAAEIELDGQDEHCCHVLATNESGEAVGTARLLPDGHIGRVAVLSNYRSLGIGRQMMVLLAKLAKEQGLEQVELSSQTHAIPFYADLGYESVGEIYDEAGAPHQRMIKAL